MTKLEVEENVELSFSKRRKKSEVKEKKGEKEVNKEQEKEKKKRVGKDKEYREPMKRKGANKGKGKKSGREENVEELRESSEEKVLAIVPPDGGWGWVVVLSSFLLLLCSDGTINSYGVFSYHIEKDFNVGIGATSTITSIAACLYYVCGWIEFWEENTKYQYPYKFRRTAPPGPVWGALGNRYGFRSILIVGSGLMAVGNIGAYFITRDFVAFAIIYSVGVGTGGGMICMSVYVMVGVYFERWRGYATSIISCGSSLGTVFMPPAYTTVIVYGWRFVFVLNSVLLFCCMLLSILVRPLKPTLVSISSRPEPKQVQFKETQNETKVKEKKVKEKKVKEKKIKGKVTAQTQLSRTQELMQSSSFVTLKGVGTAASTTSVYMSTQEERPSLRPPTDEDLEGSGARPMYRDDIFYPASAARLGSQTMYRPSGFSLMRLSTAMDLREEEGQMSNACQCCPPGVRRALATLLDTSILRSPVFIGITLSQSISVLGYHVPFLFTYARAKEAGMKEEYSELLLPLLGVANTIGRLLCGALVELPHVNALHLTSVCYASAGFFSIISCLNYGHTLQFTYVVFLGLMAAAFMAMKSIILVDYLGIERLTNAFGLLLMFQGLAALCGPPLAGFIAGATHSYDSAFYCSGTICLVGGISGFLVIPLRKYEIKKGMRDR